MILIIKITNFFFDETHTQLQIVIEPDAYHIEKSLHKYSLVGCQGTQTKQI